VLLHCPEIGRDAMAPNAIPDKNGRWPKAQIGADPDGWREPRLRSCRPWLGTRRGTGERVLRGRSLAM